MNQYFVYAYYEDGVSEPFYIGKGKGRRHLEHLLPCYLKRKDPFHKKLAKMIRDGFFPEIQILENDLSEQEAFDLEERLILKFGRKDLGTGCLYNITDGGAGGYNKEYIPKESKSPKTWLKGNHHNKIYSDSLKKPVIGMFCGSVVKRYDSLREADRAGYARRLILDVVQGRKFSAYGLQWAYEEVAWASKKGEKIHDTGEELQETRSDALSVS